MEGHGWSFPITRLTFQVRKVMGGWWGGWPVVCRIILSAPVPVPFLWTLDFGFRTWIWDLDLGLGFGTGLGLDNREEKTVKARKKTKNYQKLT